MLDVDAPSTPQLQLDDDPPRRGAGPRAQRRRALRRQAWSRRASTIVGASLGIGLVALAFLVVGPRLVDTVRGWFGDDAVATGEDDATATGVAATGPLQRRTVLVATVDEATGERVTDIQLLTVDADDRTNAIVLVPASVVTDVPGYGLIPLADAGGLGGVPLLELTLENALDVRIDAAVEMTRSSWAALFGRVGGAELTVREPVDVAVGSTTERRFEAGPQFLDGARLAELMTADVPGQSELAALPRTQQVLEGFLDAAAGELDAVFEDGAPMLQTGDPAVVEEVLRALATARADTRVDVRTLPVEPVGSGDDVVYQVDERGTAFAAEVLGAGDATAAAATDGVRLEVLNGNGGVGVGAEVAELLVPLGHQIVITGNAESFDQPATLVTVRADDEELLAAAREIVDTLGVGRVTISSLPSTTVDVTIVVGADWPGR